MEKKKIIISAILLILLCGSIYFKNVLDNSYGLRKTDKITISCSTMIWKEEEKAYVQEFNKEIEITNKKDIKNLVNPIRFQRLINEYEGCSCLYGVNYIIDYHNGFKITLESLTDNKISYNVDDKRGVMHVSEKYIEYIQEIINREAK